MVKFNQLTQQTFKKEEVSSEDFDYTSVVNFPSGGTSSARKVEHVITLLEGEDADLSPLRMREDGRGTEPNPDCSIMNVHTLPKAVNGRRTALSNKRLIPYEVTRAGGHLPVGAKSAYYDKDEVRQCVLSDAMNEWKKEAERLKKSGASAVDISKANKYRRSNIVIFKCYHWEARVTENGVTKTVPVNKVTLMGFDVKDLFWSDKSAYGKSLIENSMIDDGEGGFVDLFKDNKFVYSSSSLVQKQIKPQHTATEQKMIDNLRKEVKEGKFDEQFANLYPLTYDEVQELIESGELVVQLPSSNNHQEASVRKGIEKVSLKNLPQEVQDSLNVEDDEDSLGVPPF